MIVPDDSIELIIDSFHNEDRFIAKNRPICLWILLSIVMISVITIFFLIGYHIFCGIDTVGLITALTTLLVEVIGLLTIIFKYLFNRKENKVLDIISNIIKEIIRERR
ncbi:MAG: hypothetical protein [Podoviridae sp. ctcf755]|nr:MAG: hypothetical protein [Podoviridae sp. ctcf755]